MTEKQLEDNKFTQKQLVWMSAIPTSVIFSVIFIWIYLMPCDFNEKKDFIDLIVKIIGGIVVISGAYFAWKRLNVSEETLSAIKEDQEEKHRSEQERQITERFSRAVDQLGSIDLPIRMGGIYALDRIAKDSQKDHWAIMELLSAYIREKVRWNGKHEQESSIRKCPDIQVALTLVGEREWRARENEQQRIKLQQTNLRKAELSNLHLERAAIWKANLEKVNLTSSYLKKADLGRSFLRKANLQSAHLEEVNFTGANLEKANLENAIIVEANLRSAILKKSNLSDAEIEKTNLQGADFRKAKGLEVNQIYASRNWPLAFYDSEFLIIIKLPENHNDRLRVNDLSGYRLLDADLRWAHLKGYNLQSAVLKGAQLCGADLREADLTKADVLEANLTDANLSGADLTDVKNLTHDQLEQTIIDDQTILPSSISEKPTKRWGK